MDAGDKSRKYENLDFSETVPGAPLGHQGLCEHEEDLEVPLMSTQNRVQVMDNKWRSRDCPLVYIVSKEGIIRTTDSGLLGTYSTY